MVRRIRIHHIPEGIIPNILATTDTELQLGWSNDDHHSTLRTLRSALGGDHIGPEVVGAGLRVQVDLDIRN